MNRWCMAAMMVAAMAAAGCPMGGDGGVTESEFSATLNGANEVPPVTTSANGTVEFLVNEDGTEMVYELTVVGAVDVTQAHIHVGPAGENGAVVAFLFESPGEPVTVDTLSAQGVLTDEDLVGPLEGRTLADLIEAMTAGNTYANVHTSANEGGEVRGQIGAN